MISDNLKDKFQDELIHIILFWIATILYVVLLIVFTF